MAVRIVITGNLVELPAPGLCQAGECVPNILGSDMFEHVGRDQNIRIIVRDQLGNVTGDKFDIVCSFLQFSHARRQCPIASDDPTSRLCGKLKIATVPATHLL